MRNALFKWVLAPILIFAPILTASAQEYCGTLFFEDQVFANFHQKVLTKNVNFDQILNFLKQDSRLGNLLSAANGDPGHPSIETHSREVYQQWRRQAPPAERLSMMPVLIALHDIGKPLAILAGDRDQQHQHTLPLVNELMRKYHFSKNEILIAERLLLNSSLPRLLKGVITAQEAAQEIQSEAQNLKTEALDFFKWKLAFFSADAGGYPVLRDHLFFSDEKGRLVAKSPNIKILEKLLQSPPATPSASE